MVTMTDAQVDALAIAFTVFASIWLVLALVYMFTVCIFFRMRGRGELRGSMSDPAWGRVYLLRHSTRYYLPMGWLFRRYIMFQRSGEDRARIAKIRVMSVQERRAAVEELFRRPKTNNIEGCCNHTESSAAAVAANAPAKKGDSNQNAELAQQQQAPLSSAAVAQTELAPDHGVSENHSVDAPSDEMNDSNGCPNKKPNEMALLSQSTPLPNETALLSEPSPPPCCAQSAAGSSEHEEDYENTCPICFGPYSAQDPFLDSPACVHRYHWNCIVSWLEFQSHRDCPCCRIEIVSEEDIWKIVREHRRKKESEKTKKSATAVAGACKQQPSRPSNANNNTTTNQGSIQRGATEDEEEDDDSSIPTRRSHPLTELVIQIPLGNVNNKDNNQELAQQQEQRQQQQNPNMYSEITVQEAATSGSLGGLLVGRYDLESQQEIHSLESYNEEEGEGDEENSSRPQNVMRARSSSSDGAVVDVILNETTTVPEENSVQSRASEGGGGTNHNPLCIGMVSRLLASGRFQPSPPSQW